MSKEGSDNEDGCGCMIIIVLGGILLWYMVTDHPRPRSAESICAQQHAGDESEFCRALAQKYKGGK